MRRKPEGPCYHCETRVPENPEQGTEDCHKTCERYKKYRQELDEFKRSQLSERRKRELGERPWRRRHVINPVHD